MKILLTTLTLLLFCLTPTLAQFADADAAAIALEQLEISEEPQLALNQIMNIDLSQASPQRRVEFGLLAADYTISLRRFDLSPKYLSLVEESLNELPASPRAMAQFLYLTLQQKADGFLKPERARRELLPNLDRALNTIKDYKVTREDGETWICSQLFLGRAFAYWIRELVEYQVLLDQDLTEPISQVRKRAEETALDWATTEQTIASLGMSHGYLSELLAVQSTLELEDPLYPLLGQYQFLNDIRAVAKEKNAELLVEAALGRVVARRNLYRVARIAEQAVGRTYTVEEADQVRQALQEAAELSQDQASFKLVAELFVTGFEASFSSSKPGWREAARKGFSTPPNFLKNFPELSTRYFTARARLNLLDQDNAQAVKDAEMAVRIYQSWFRESGLSEEGLSTLRRRAGWAHEVLIQARLAQGDTAGAFASAADYQALESLSVLSVKGGREIFGQITADGISESLHPDQAVVAFFPGRLKLYSFLLTHEGLKSDVFDIGAETLQGNMLKTLAALRSQSPADDGRRRLHGTLFGRYDLSRFKRLEIAPSSFLSNMPWGALLNSDGEALTQTHDLSVKLTLAPSPPPSPKPTKIRAIGNPDGSLPSAQLEVEGIASLFETANVATGEKADRSFVDAFSEDVMHFATHGSVNFRKPHTSYLLLAGNEHLTAREIAEETWGKAGIVVLSACNTGNSSLDLVGHRSLAGAFLKGGAPAVLATLWPVDDRATRVLMSHFYAALSSGLNPEESLKTAQLKLLETPELSAPFYWGGFVLFER